MRKGFQLFQIQEMFLAARTNKDFQRATVVHGFCGDEVHGCRAVAACDESDVLAGFPLIAGAERAAKTYEIAHRAASERFGHRTHGEERDLGLRAVIERDAERLFIDTGKPEHHKLPRSRAERSVKCEGADHVGLLLYRFNAIGLGKPGLERDRHLICGSWKYLSCLAAEVPGACRQRDQKHYPLLRSYTRAASLRRLY